MNESTLTGDIRVHHNFYSPQLKNSRSIMIYLPPSYRQASSHRYPVLYMHDGQNLFDAKVSVAGIEWQIDETTQELIEKKKLREVIIVGIFNTEDRDKEYAPWVDAKCGGGLGVQYMNFVVETLKPFVDNTYRTLHDCSGIAGSSLGGLISLFGFAKYPHVFSFAGILSPALFWDNHRVFETIQHANFTNNHKLWLHIGTCEEYEIEGYENLDEECQTLLKLLESKGFKPEINLHFDRFEGGHHSEADWGNRVKLMMKFLLGIEH